MYISQIHQIKKDILSKILIFYQSGIPAVLLIPRNYRYSRQSFEQSDKEKKFCNTFNTILYNTFCQLSELMQNDSDLDRLLPIANNVLKLYLELLNQGHDGYEKGETSIKKLKALVENPNTTIQQNHLSHQIIYTEFMSIIKMLMQIKVGKIVIINVLIDDVSKILKDYIQQIADGWSLRKDYEKYIADKCNCLVHTIGQMYVEEDETEIEALFTTAFKLQEQLITINPDCFEIIMIEYFRYRMLKFMQNELVDNKTEIAFWKAVLEYVSIGEKCKTYNDSLKRFLKSLKVLSNENSDNTEEISEAINTVKKVVGQMIESLYNEH